MSSTILWATSGLWAISGKILLTLHGFVTSKKEIEEHMFPNNYQIVPLGSMLTPR
jgi:hypothetical protein